MASTPIPRALALIADDPNLAVDAALAAALPWMDEAAQDETLRVLGRRGHVPTLTGIVSKFSTTDPTDQRGPHGVRSEPIRADRAARDFNADTLRLETGATPRHDGRVGHSGDLHNALLRHVSDLHSGLRSAIESHELSTRLAAIALIVAADDARSAYVLAGALRSTCHQTREAAATALHTMTARLLVVNDAGPEQHSPGAEARTPDEVAARRRALADALANAIRGWEVHFQLPALEAALWLSADLEAVIVEKLNEPRSRIGHALQEILETATDGRLAGFVLRALAIPWLRPAAAKAIGHARGGTFLRSLAQESSLLADPKVSAGCHWVHDCAWARTDGQWPKGIPASDAAKLVHLFARTGVASDRKMTVLGAWQRSNEESVQRAALEVLIADPCDAATRVLTEIGARASGRASDGARQEIRRRRRSHGTGAAPHTQSVLSATDASEAQTTTDTAVAHARSSDDAFERFLDEFDALAPGERRLRADLFRNIEGDLDPRVLVKLRAKLASGIALDRALGLRAAREVGAVQDLAERIYPLAHDADPFVRSIAVAILAKLPGATSERILRRAVEDVDLRVQANAIEALDRLDAEDRTRWTEPKLESRNNRVRANAVCSLLRLDLRRAGEAMLDMMDDPASEHRMSALWVIEHLRLRSAMHRVLKMSREDADERIRKRAGRLMRALTNHAGESFAPRDSTPNSPASVESSE